MQHELRQESIQRESTSEGILILASQYAEIYKRDEKMFQNGYDTMQLNVSSQMFPVNGPGQTAGSLEFFHGVSKAKRIRMMMTEESEWYWGDVGIRAFLDVLDEDIYTSAFLRDIIITQLDAPGILIENVLTQIRDGLGTIKRGERVGITDLIGKVIEGRIKMSPTQMVN